MSNNGKTSKPPDEKPHVRNTLLDILCNIDVVSEIQEENEKVLGVFDHENTVVALFEIIKMNITYHKGNHMNFPQICADIFSSLPDRFVNDIGYNDYLMDLFFSIPQDSHDSRQASCFCQIIERFVSSVPYVLFTYLQQNAQSVIRLLLLRISLSSYLNSIRYLLDIPIYNKACWWHDSTFFVDSIFAALEDTSASFNAKELVLSIIQRATVFSKEDDEGPCYFLLPILLDEDHCLRLFSILTKNLEKVLHTTLSLETDKPNDPGVYLAQFVNAPMEIANNCFLILSRYFWKYSHGLTTGRGGYNRCFNASAVPMQELMKKGGIQSRSLLSYVVKHCISYFPLLFNTVCSLVKCHCEMESSQLSGSAIFSLAPKPVLGFCEFCYHFINHQEDTTTWLFFIQNGFIDDLLMLLEVYPHLTNLHVNIIDILISMIYSNDLTVLTSLVTKTRLLEVVYECVIQKSISSVKSQLFILLQVIAGRCVQRKSGKKGISGKLFQKILLSNPFFERITSALNIFAIYPPLVGMQAIDDQQPTFIPQVEPKSNQDLFTIPM